MGHMRVYTISDVISRYRRMQGYNVLNPMGFDAFGLPTENAAIKNGMSPAKWTQQTTEYMFDQMKRIGTMYDYTRMVNTSSPEFYKWTQWIFIQLFKKDLAFESYEPINWCPGCQTVIANEQVLATQFAQLDRVPYVAPPDEGSFGKFLGFLDGVLSGADRTPLTLDRIKDQICTVEHAFRDSHVVSTKSLDARV